MSLGPIMLDLRGPVLEPDEREMLQHPLVGGVILFARNYQDIDQLVALTGHIHTLRRPPLLIAVDHEGGRVQRFRESFTRLPPCRSYGHLYERDAEEAGSMAGKAGWLMAMELLVAGVDFSFAPVLDLDMNISRVIGDRAFHGDPETVTDLGRHFMRGMKTAGMAAVGKHFPGHGGVREDSHLDIPVDDRRFEDIMMQDMVPFERLIGNGLPGIMPAHVVYKQVDGKPAGFSPVWLKQILRQRLGYQGVIFSDDISMAGAGVAGDYPDRAMAAVEAGCDMVLVCNNQEAALSLLSSLELEPDPVAQVRLMRMHGRDPGITPPQLQQDIDWRATSAELVAMNTTPELDLGDDEIQT
ncbi:MAG: beta-N-acetylhexosaminidase [Gammaproteobacteria bacterium]